ncbi:MAG TPA: alanine racemase [Bryobacteraceae bacterium]|jgi:alanine racemase|nr:alanine racemase [Bryobacteraceae bacterium]
MNGAPYRSWVEVSLSRIRSNFESIRALTGPGVEVMPVVKADAYRHGAIEVSRTLMDAGARWLAVSSVEEGVQLRQADIQARILVMADFLPAERDALFDYHLTPVIHSLDDVSAFDLEARKRDIPADFHLKIDSGMGRLGTRAGAADIAPVLKRCSHARIEGLMTHFASAADYAGGQTEEQTQTFLAVKSGLESLDIAPKYIHMASGIPVAYGRRETWQKMVRPGHAIYGYVSPVSRGAAPARQVDVRPALVWKAALLAVKDIPEGAKVGYGGMFRAPQAMRIGILAAGYADGIPHRLSNKGKVIAGGRFAPILGAVSMDLTTIDLTHAPHLKPGDAVTLLGSEGSLSIDAQQMARLAGTISYSVLCGISARVKRVYV